MHIAVEMKTMTEILNGNIFRQKRIILSTYLATESD